MDISKLDKENLGNYFIELSKEFLLKEKYGKSYEFLKIGLNLVTYDIDVKINNTSIEINYKDIEEVLVKSYFYNNSNNKIVSFLNSEIVKNQKTSKTILGKTTSHLTYFTHYILSRVLIRRKEYQNAVDLLSQIHRNIPLRNFIIGYIKEEFLNQWGIEELYFSFKENPSSTGCLTKLHEYSYKRNIKLSEWGINSQLEMEGLTRNPNYLVEQFNINENFIEIYKNYGGYVKKDFLEVLFDDYFNRDKFLDPDKLEKERIRTEQEKIDFEESQKTEDWRNSYGEDKIRICPICGDMAEEYPCQTCGK